MSVEFIPAADVRRLMRTIQEARQRAIDACGPTPPSNAASYWERLFETNAAEVLSVLPSVQLAAGYSVRYRFFGRRGQDLMVRPFVARTGTDVEVIRRLLDWHPPPDSRTSALSGQPTRDVELLYQHFSFPLTAAGVFEYWLAMQELWASQRWTHAHLVASAEELSQITAGEGWQVLHPVEAYEPAVVRGDGSARIAVLMQSPVRRFEITLEQIDIAADHALQFAEPILVASGPRGYLV